ncbi:MAG: Caudovirus prohead serine protease [Thermoanaerobacterium sp.]|nr:Caudovirus prohead serine protease [Thermoanaerobacterium sp.]
MMQQKPFIFYATKLETKSFYDEEAKRKRYFVKGYIDTGDLDLVNDIVTEECMKDLAQQLNSRSIKLDFDHETLRAGKDEDEFDAKLNLTKVPLGKAISHNLDSKGNEVEFELNPNWKKFNSKGDVVMTFEELWDNIQNGFYDSFSIAYVPQRTKYVEKNGVKARLLDKVNLINVALTGNPINPAATMTAVMAKSLDSIKEQEDFQDELKMVREDIKSLMTELKKYKGDIMAEEKKSEEKVEDKSEKVEKQEKAEEPKKEDKSEKVEDKSIKELKSDIDELKSEIAKITKILDEAVPKSLGAEDKSKISEARNTKIKSDLGPLDLI